MSPSEQCVSSSLSADDFAAHFSLKIDNICASTAIAPSPTIDVRSASTTPLSNFRPVDAVEIVRLLSSIPVKHCHLDPVPTWLVKRAAVVLAPVLSLMCHCDPECFLTYTQTCRCLPAVEEAVTRRRRSYRPISNLSFVLKLVERVAACRFVDHAEENKLFPVKQSAYRRHHHTESSVVKVMDDITRSIDDDVLLDLLDLIAVFDTVDHDILLEILQNHFSINDIPFSWFHSYLTDLLFSQSM